jgi:FKBP-type peptidyl-prolyl cis-trans isomerase 2
MSPSPAIPRIGRRLASSASMLLLAVAVLAAAGCTGLPAGSADNGDTVTVRYSVTDLDGKTVRTERTATFVLGSGDSGLGLAFERALRGHLPNENLTFTVKDDPSLEFAKTVEVDRELPGIEQVQDADRQDFEDNVGPATIGQTFPAFGIYTATVTGITADRVNFTIDAQPMQRNDVSSVGAVLVSDPDGTMIHRTLDPKVGATFVINPPSPSNPQTPLGLEPGSYRTLGATQTTIQYGFSTSGALDLVGKDLRFRAVIVRLTPGQSAIEPVCQGEDADKDCNYAARPAPYVNGDPESVLDAMPTADEPEAGHTH